MFFNISLMLQLLEAQQQVHDLKVQLTTLQSNHKETFEQLSDKSKLIVALKSELDRISQQNHSMSEEVSLMMNVNCTTIILFDC